MRLLNIGCGSTFDPAWVNIDIEPLSPEVLRYDARKRLPFEDGSFDACYSSHVIEHLSCEQTLHIMKEFHRILKKGGILRLAVPDLEGIARAYLGTLDQAIAGSDSADKMHDWMIIELIDQMVRVRNGGEMGKFMDGCPMEMRDFIVSRIGSEAKNFWVNKNCKKSIFSRIFKKSPRWFLDKIRYQLIFYFSCVIAGNRGKEALKEGWFRTSGEVHRWMYDRFSIGKLLSTNGFNEIRVCSPGESRIPDFNSYALEAKDSKVLKPDSLIIEGIRQ